MMDREAGVRDTDVPGCSGLGVGGTSSDAFIDRSRVRILLCDNNLKNSEEAFTLLCKCSYQVTSVKSARQVIDALNAEGPEIDIILSEVDLPMAKGMKMLKYIMRDKDLRRIPVIMMSAQDEVSTVVKCLRLGAADYLVKPLRTNELLNLWTHMWRRRRMLGLVEKNIMNYEFDPVASDPSDANTNSTTLFSDDTDDKSRKSMNPEMCVPAHQEDEPNATVAASVELYAPLEPSFMHSLDYCPNVPGISDRRTESSHAYKATPPRGRQIASCPKKSELRIGESSAFFTYVKSNLPRSSAQGIIHDLENTKLYSSTQDKLDKRVSQVANDTQDFERAEVRETGGRLRTSDPLRPHNAGAFSTGSSIYIEVQENETLADNLPTSRRIMELPQLRNSRMETYSQVHIDPSSDSQPDVFISHSNTISMEKSPTPPVPKEFPQLNNSRTETNSHLQTSYPYFHPGLMNQVMMPQYPHFPQYSPHVPNMPSFPYYPMGLCLQPGQIPMPQHQWPSFGTDVKLSKVDRREAALMKFRQKRKERCFDKKIRYVNRKRLAEKRPRVRGQFVRKMNGIDVDLNGTPGSVDLDEDEDEEDENAGVDFSPDDDA